MLAHGTGSWVAAPRTVPTMRHVPPGDPPRATRRNESRRRPPESEEHHRKEGAKQEGPAESLAEKMAAEIRRFLFFEAGRTEIVGVGTARWQNRLYRNRSRRKPGTASPFQRAELEAVPALLMRLAEPPISSSLSAMRFSRPRPVGK